MEEEEAWNYEMGYKSRLLDGRMALTVAAYRTEVTDQQFTTVIETATGTSASLIDNVGETEINGLEVEVETLLTDALTLNVGYSWTQAEITQWINSDQADLLGANGSLFDLDRLAQWPARKYLGFRSTRPHWWPATTARRWPRDFPGSWWGTWSMKARGSARYTT